MFMVGGVILILICRYNNGFKSNILIYYSFFMFFVEKEIVLIDLYYYFECLSDL